MSALSIDFGTSNTVAVVRTPDGGARALLLDSGAPMMPSAVYLDANGTMLVGRDAERNARIDPTRYEPNPKRRIDDGSILLGDQEVPTTNVISMVLSRVLTEARRQLGGPPEAVRVTHPARWGQHRRAALQEAATASGMRSLQLIPEPVAAASYFTAVHGATVGEGRSIAIYDLGGGTFDATVVQRTRSGFSVLAEGGVPDVGGLDFDHAIIEHLGATYAQNHEEQWKQLLMPMDGAQRRHRRMLWEDVRAAKETLSRSSQANIHIPSLELDVHLTRDELENLIRPLLQRTVQCLQTTIESAGLTPQNLAGIFLVGGSSRIPLAAHLIHTQLSVAPTTLDQPETVVAEGALRVAGGGTSTNTGAPPGVGGAPNGAISGPPLGQQTSGSPVSGSPTSGGRPPLSGPPMQQSPPPQMPPQQQPPSPQMPPQQQSAPPRMAPQPPLQQPPPMQPPQRPSARKQGVQPGVVVGIVAVLTLSVILLLLIFWAAM